MTINLKGLARVDVLVALHNAARPKALHGGYPTTPMDTIEADELLSQATYFTFVNGRALFVDLGSEEFDARDYDSHNGRGCAAEALAPLIARYTREPTADEDRAFVEAIMGTGTIPRMQQK
jgi:hypothetical protein